MTSKPAAPSYSTTLGVPISADARKFTNLDIGFFLFVMSVDDDTFPVKV